MAFWGKKVIEKADTEEKMRLMLETAWSAMRINGLEPTALNDEVLDEIGFSTINILHEKCPEFNQEDFVAQYLMSFAFALHGMKEEEYSSKCLVLCSAFLQENKGKMNSQIYHDIKSIVDQAYG